MVLGERLKILVGVYMVRAPLGPQFWHYLQYALGLERLGHDVTIVEVSDDHEWTCYDPRTGEIGTDPSYGLAFTGEVMDRVGFGDRWAYLDLHGDGWTGPAARTVRTTVAEADLLLNVSGLNLIRPAFEDVPLRVFVDTDPGFVQVRNLTKHGAMDETQNHNAFVTFGERVGAADCLIPDDGITWTPTRQPVVLDEWPVTPVPAGAAFTTIMKWDSYRPRALGGLALGMKSQSFPPYSDLPRDAPAPLEMLVGGPYPHDDLAAAGWTVRDPQAVTPDPWAFKDYIAGSAGEFTVAKHGYVATRSGWFSERSAHYLASGRPVVTQDTGFSDVIPSGHGLLAFSDRGEALAALEEVVAHPAKHAAAARELAEEVFDSRTVLQRLLNDVCG